MFSRPLLSVAVIVTALTACAFAYVKGRQSFSTVIPENTVAPKKNLRLTIAVIGDSWASKRKLDTIIVNRLSEAGISCQVFSSGHPGAVSKRIYENLFAEKDDVHSSRFILNSNPDYCVVVAGVNDSFGQFGEDFYSEHLSLIIKTLKARNIKPIVVELPEYGIEEGYHELGFLRRTRNMALAQIMNDGQINNIERYRDAFLKKVKPDENQVILIDFDGICKDYERGSPLFKSDHFHLSLAGQQILGGAIAKQVIQDQRNNARL